MHAKPDTNQKQIVADLRDAGCRVINVSSLPGYQIEMEDTYEVKEGNRIEDPLDLFILSPCYRYWVQAEVKKNWHASFRPGQIAYFRSLGNWPPERPSGVPVIAIYDAGDALNWFHRRCGCEQCNQALLEWREKNG
jgi:hypothetical protein